MTSKTTIGQNYIQWYTHETYHNHRRGLHDLQREVNQLGLPQILGVAKPRLLGMAETQQVHGVYRRGHVPSPILRYRLRSEAVYETAPLLGRCREAFFFVMAMIIFAEERKKSVLSVVHKKRRAK